MRKRSSLATILAAAIVAATPAAAAGSQAKADDTTTGAAQVEPASPPAPAPTAPAPAAPVPAASTPVASAPAAPVIPAPILPDPALTNTMNLVRKSPIGSEPNVASYLDLMKGGKASGAQVNDFAAYVAKRGMPKVAISFQQYALRLEPQNSILWLNLGTLQRTTGDFGPAVTSFNKAITIDPINALAHYNLGAVYDAQNHYDDAIEEYRRALVLDPGLADPRKNPQVVNNENLLAVELEIYHSQAGALGLPLLQIQKSAPPPKAAAPVKQ